MLNELRRLRGLDLDAQPLLVEVLRRLRVLDPDLLLGRSMMELRRLRVLDTDPQPLMLEVLP
jgi:hypothetical protein